MRHLNRLVALAVAAVALGTGATSALAAEFVAAPGAATRSTSGTAGELTFHFGPFLVTCAAAKGRGSVVSPDVLGEEVKFEHCEDAVEIGTQTLRSPAVFKGPVGITHGASGLAAMSVFKVAIKAPKCTIVAGLLQGGVIGLPQIVGTSYYANESYASRKLRLFPTGFQQELSVETEANGFYVGYEGACSGFESSDEGSYFGIFTVEAVHGNLEGDGSEEEGWNRVHND